MLIPWISSFTRSGIPKARGRRLAAARRLQVEFLEDRTAMSSGWLGSLVGGTVSRTDDPYAPPIGWAGGAGAVMISKPMVSNPDSLPAIPTTWPTGWAVGPGAMMISKSAEPGVDNSMPAARLGTFPYVDVETNLALRAPRLDVVLNTISGTLVASGTEHGGPFHGAFQVLVSDLGGAPSFPPPFASGLSPGGPSGLPLDPRDAVRNELVFIAGRLAAHSMDLGGANGSTEGLNFDSLIPLVMQFADSNSIAGAASSGASNPAAPGEPAIGSSTEGWMSYVSTGGWGSPLFQTQSFRGFNDAVRDDLATSPIPPVTTVGDAAWGDFLEGPYSLSQSPSDGHTQVIELAPLPGSSLALVATLWTVSPEPGPDHSSERAEWAGPNDGRLAPHAQLATPPSWAGFVIGLDEAFEQSRVSVRDEIVTGAWQPVDDGRSQGGTDEPVVSCSPIAPIPSERARELTDVLPGASSVVVLKAGMHSQGTGAARTPEQRPGATEGQEDELDTDRESQPGSEKGKPVTAWGLSLLSASASVLIAGRAWIKRLRRRRLRLVNTRPLDR